MRSILQDIGVLATMSLAIVYIAFTSVAIYFQLSFDEPSWVIRIVECTLGFVAIGSLWVLSLSLLGRGSS